MFATLAGMAGMTLLVQALLAYLLLPEGRGAYAVCIVFGTILGSILSPGAREGAQYFAAAGPVSVSQCVSSLLVICLVGGGLAGALSAPLIYSDLAFFQKAETPTFLLALAMAPVAAISIALDHQFVALRRFRRLAVFSMLRLLVNVLAILVLVRVLGMGAGGAVIALTAAHGIMIAACLLDLRGHRRMAFELPRLSSLTLILGYGLRYHPARMGAVLEGHLGVFVLGLIATQSEIGLFAAASALMLGVLLISNAVGVVLYPRVAGQERLELVALCLRLVGAATALCLLVLVALSVPLVRLLLSASFMPAVPLLWIIAPAILASALSAIFVTHFKGTNLPGVCSWAVFLGLSVNLSVLLLLYPRLGVAAAAWAMTAGMGSGCLFHAIVFHRTTRMSLAAAWLPRRSDVTYLWAAGRSALAGGIRGKPPAPVPLKDEVKDEDVVHESR